MSLTYSISGTCKIQHFLIFKGFLAILAWGRFCGRALSPGSGRAKNRVAGVCGRFGWGFGVLPWQVACRRKRFPSFPCHLVLRLLLLLGLLALRIIHNWRAGGLPCHHIGVVFDCSQTIKKRAVNPLDTVFMPLCFVTLIVACYF